MKAMQARLRDRKRAQQGSVLSGVLIMVAFLAILSGALMTELSTHFLISRALVNRVGNEATVSSAMELALDQLQITAPINGCPGPISNTPLPAIVTLNGRTASVAYLSCAPVVHEPAKFVSIASPAVFNVDGTHSTIPGQDLYLVGDSGGRMYQYQFGQSSPNWSMDLQTNITGPPLAMADYGASPPDPQDISNLVPIAGGGSSGCSAIACVKLLQQDTNLPGPDVFCYMAANGSVTSRPAAGVGYPTLVYFGDSSGTLFSYQATEAGNCFQQARITTPGNAAIVAGPIVFPNGSRDEVYVVTAKGNNSQLLRFENDQSDSPSLQLLDTLTLPYSSPVGVAVDQTSTPARLAITFAGGGVALASIPSNFHPNLSGSTVLGAAIAAAPSWCSCPYGPQIGVAGVDGLHILDTSLSQVASYASGSAVRTTPASDGVGEWFFGADDGNLYEVQQWPGQSTLTLAAKYAVGGQVRSSVQVAACPVGSPGPAVGPNSLICIYLGSTSNAYLVPLDARAATITACLSSSRCAGSSDNPRLWAQVEVGVAGSPQTVHVQGWSYYSP